MRRLAIISALALWSGSGGAQDRAAITKAEEAADICFSMRALALDDGKSDAATIGRAVLTACIEQRRAYIRAMVPPGTSDDLVNQVIERRREADLDLATASVLIHRRHAVQKSKP